MKKHLIAAAVAAAVVAPAAMAQQVTVYGVLDASFTTASDVGSASPSITQQSVNSSLLSTSRIGFRGEEDLGGGLKAGFVLETGITNDQADVNAAGTESKFDFGDRGAEVFLNGGFGEVRIGKAATSDANIVCSGPTNLTNFAGSTTGGAVGCNTGTRPDNRVQYITPSMSGFKANIAYSTQNTRAETLTEDTKKNGRYTNIGAEYSAGPLRVLAFQAQVEVDTAADATSGKLQDMGLLARYDFGIANAQLRYVETKSKDITAAIKVQTTAIDVGVPLGNGLSLGLGYLTASNKETANADYDRTVVMLVKDLSKRTNVYAVYAKTSNDSGANFGSGAAGVGTFNGQDPSLFGVGVRHSF